MYRKLIDLLGFSLFVTISIGGMGLGLWATFWGPSWLAGVVWGLTPYAEPIIIGAWIWAFLRWAFFDASDLTFAIWITGTRTLIWVISLSAAAVAFAAKR